MRSKKTASERAYVRITEYLSHQPENLNNGISGIQTYLVSLLQVCKRFRGLSYSVGILVGMIAKLQSAESS